MTRFSIIFLFIAIGCSLMTYSQENQKPEHLISGNSVYVEFMSPVQDLYHSIDDSYYYDLENRFFMPSMSIGYERKLCKSRRWFLEAGIAPFTSTLGKTIGKTSYYSLYGPVDCAVGYYEFVKYFAYSGYVGSLIKLKLFQNFYLAPSLNIYYDYLKFEYSNEDPGPLSEHGPVTGSNYLVSAGPTLSCEWVFAEHWSGSCDLVDWVFRIHGEKQVEPIHKKLALALHYNF